MSFLNDSISFVLRGAILIELSLLKKIATSKESKRKSLPLNERNVIVVDGSNCGDSLLDEALRLIKSDSENSVASWIELLSGETWNPLKVRRA